jgi:hypothetical protein
VTDVATPRWMGLAPGLDSAATKYVAENKSEEQAVAVTVDELPGVATLSPEDLVEEAARLHRVGEWDQAAAHYGSALQLYYQRGPMAAECHNQRGACLAELGAHPRRKLADADKLQMAVDEHSRAIELEPVMFKRGTTGATRTSA